VAVCSLGEVLFDHVGTARLPGGAPANVACHIAALAERSALISRVGGDAAGGELACWLKERMVDAELLQTDRSYPTGVVVVGEGPRYEIAESAAWDFLEVTEANRRAAASAGVVVFGTLAQRQPTSRRTIRTLLAAARAAGVPVLCDLNLRSPFYSEETVLWSLRNCDFLKLNEDELHVVSHMLHAQVTSTDLFEGLLREFAIPLGVLTCGERGAWLHESGETWHQPAANPGRLADAVGAGDAFTAVISIALQRHISLRQAGPAAAELAAYIVSQPGATPVIPAGLAARITAMLAV